MSGILRKNPMEGYNSREQLLIQYKKYSSIWSIFTDRDVLIAVLMGGFEFETKSISFITLISSPMSFTPSMYIYM